MLEDGSYFYMHDRIRTLCDVFMVAIYYVKSFNFNGQRRPFCCICCCKQYRHLCSGVVGSTGAVQECLFLCVFSSVDSLLTSKAILPKVFILVRFGPLP